VVNRNTKKTRALGSDCWPKNELLTSTIQFQGYDETVATNTYADYHIYYHTKSATDMDCERVLRKPIIFIDGFDAQNERPYSDIYKYELINIQNPSQNLGEELRKLGYDLVILNFPMLGQKINKSELLDTDLLIPLAVNNGTVTPINGRDGGTDYIERNAFALVKLIQDLNGLLPVGSTEQLRIVGPSMGGQIARYALAYMEHQQVLGTPNMNHNTRLYISFDSPHDGANIPISVSQTLDHFGNFYGQQVAATFYNQKIRSKATRQLLIEQLDGLNGTATFYSTYYNALRNNGIVANKGWPVNCRKVGIASGSKNGTLNGIADNQAVSVLAYVALGQQAIHFNLRTMPNYNNTNLSYNGFGKRGITAMQYGPPPTVHTYSNPCLDILKHTAYSETSFGLFKIVRTWSTDYTTKNMNARGIMDIVPGGIFNAFEEIYTAFNGVFNNTSSIKQVDWQPNLVKYHTFIPTISALAFKNPNFNWANKVNDRNLVCSNETYFDNYIASSQNTGHTKITNEIYDFTLEEIQKGRKGTDCYDMCPATITGDDCIKQNITSILVCFNNSEFKI
jgi:pimeloyl-ACP methyl ester carboxylesterase